MSAPTPDEMKALVAEARRHAEALVRGTETGDADLLHDLAYALEAVYDAGRRELAERFANQDETREGAIEELIAWEDEREAVADLIAEGFPHPGGGSRVVWEDCIPVADAILQAGFTRLPGGDS